MTIDRWKKFTKSQQLLTIGAEFMRANVWQRRDKEKFLLALERALQLIDFSISDSKWKDSLGMLLGFRDIVAEFYTFKRTDNILILYYAL